MEKYIQFGAKRCQKYELYEKLLEIKVVEHWIPYTKVRGSTCLSRFPPRVELGGFKDCYISNIILYWNGKVDSVWGSPQIKIRIISENASNKSCWALNFEQKSQWAHMSIFPSNEARGLQRLVRFKYYIVLKWKIRFTLGIDAAKNTDYIKKFFI